MTYNDDFTLPIEYLEQLAEQGMDFMPELIRILLNVAMRATGSIDLLPGIRPNSCSSARLEGRSMPTMTAPSAMMEVIQKSP